MQVKRIVANFGTAEPNQARTFYEGILGLDLGMDHGWIQTYELCDPFGKLINILSHK